MLCFIFAKFLNTLWFSVQTQHKTTFLKIILLYLLWRETQYWLQLVVQRHFKRNKWGLIKSVSRKLCWTQSWGCMLASEDYMEREKWDLKLFSNLHAYTSAWVYPYVHSNIHKYACSQCMHAHMQINIYKMFKAINRGQPESPYPYLFWLTLCYPVLIFFLCSMVLNSNFVRFCS